MPDFAGYGQLNRYCDALSFTLRCLLPLAPIGAPEITFAPLSIRAGIFWISVSTLTALCQHLPADTMARRGVPAISIKSVIKSTLDVLRRGASIYVLSGDPHLLLLPNCSPEGDGNWNGDRMI